MTCTNITSNIECYYFPVWNKALGKIGCMTTALQKLLMWALHLEEEPCVRIAACEVLSMLEPKDPELQQFLQERYAMEPNTEVKRYVLRLESLLEAMF